MHMEDLSYVVACGECKQKYNCNCDLKTHEKEVIKDNFDSTNDISVSSSMSNQAFDIRENTLMLENTFKSHEDSIESIDTNLKNKTELTEDITRECYKTDLTEDIIEDIIGNDNNNEDSDIYFKTEVVSTSTSSLASVAGMHGVTCVKIHLKIKLH